MVVDFKEQLARIIVGQPDAVSRVADCLEVAESRFGDQRRPGAVILLLGPTGSGKTRLAEAAAEVLHGDDRMIRVDCAEYQHSHEIAKLIGAPPGYLGHREGDPRLTAKKLENVVSDRSSTAVVLFDEIEKGHVALHQLLLGIFDRATMTLGDGKKVFFGKTVIFMTSNVGAREFEAEVDGSGIGFGSPGRAGAGLAARSLAIGRAALKRGFSPEFINRIDEIVGFGNLTREDQLEIFDREIAKIESNLYAACLPGERFMLQVSVGARRRLVDEGFSPAEGARALKRTLHRRVVVPLARMKRSGELFGGAIARVDDDLRVTTSKGSLATLLEASIRLKGGARR